jgi:uncharacterized protein involved in outer membrane biogenesis
MLAMFAKIDPAASARALVRHPRTRLWGKRFAIFMVVVGILGFFAVPPLLKSVLLTKLGEALHRDVTIESISINPYTLTATLSGVSVRERAEGKTGEELIGFDSLRVNAELASIAVAGIVVKEIELVGPRVRLVRLADNRYNISDLIDEQMAKPPSNDPLPRFSVSNIQIRGGKVEFDDRPEGVTHAVTDIALQIPFLSTLSYYSDTYVEPHFSASINGAPLQLTGKSRPFGDSQESELVLNLDNLQIGRYLGYSPVDLPIKVLSGAVDGDLRLRFVQTKQQPSTLSLAGKVEVKELKVEESNGLPLLGMKRLEVVLREVDLLKLGVGVESVLVESPEVDVRVSKQGVMNWLELVPASAENAPAQKAAKASPSLLTVASIAVKDGVVNIQDQSTSAEQKGSIRNLQVDASNYDSSGARPLEFSVGWRVDAGERLAVEQVKLSDGKLDLAKHSVSIGEYAIQGVRAKFVRGKDGSIQWFKSPALRIAQAASKDKSEPWQVTVARVRMQDQQYQFEDRKFSPAAMQTLELTSLDAENISTLPDSEAKLSANLRINKKGTLAVEGKLKPMLPQGELNLDVREIELLPFQPYFSEFLNITVTRGQVAAKGAISLAKAKEGVSAGYKGDLTLGNFHSVDKANSADFLKWKSFYFGGIDVQTAPLSVAVGEVALSDFYARVIVSPEGKLNLMQVVKGDDSAKPEKPAEGVPSTDAPAAAEPAVSAVSAGEGKAVAPVADKPAKEVIPIKIGKVTLQGGNINFSDNFIKPNYSANLTKIGGRITGLSSAAGSIADMELRGSYDNLAPLKISAKLNPFAAKSYLDLDAEVKGIELTGFSTYSGKYAGYAIERGKLSLFLKYKIDNNQLSADNRVFLDQLTFGDEVDSPGATRLPVRLAVSLLQNRKGEIDINLPISGSLDDPQFSVGGIVVQVILNVFTKAITSPFALIGSLFGGGEELSYVEFDYGYSTISAKMKERLQTVAKVLDDRPAIRIEIAGRIDPDRDREGLKQALMERRVKAQRLEELVKAGTEAGSLDDIEIPAKDYPKYLERAYKAEKFPKPRNLVGMVKDLPVEEMEKLMMANMKADDEALRDLADRRAKAASQWLGREGKVAADRVFLLKPNLSAKEGPQNDKASEARADFSLK